jgi:tRNA-splicing ligase RtcB
MKKIITDTLRHVKIWTDDVEESALKQLRNVASLPIIHNHVAAMADVHAGKGSTIGTVIATDGAVIPSAVGVDIGCGMCAVRFPI